jgi:hypothetical protein
MTIGNSDSDINDNTELVSRMIRTYNKKEDDIPVENTSLDIETEKNIYKLIRLNDEQYYLLRKNAVGILEDYGLLMQLYMCRDTVYSSFSKLYAALKILFGESGKYYDDWKGSFSFPFLIHFHKRKREYGYVMNLMNLRTSVEFNLAKLISPGNKRIKRGILHEPFKEFPREEITYFINYFIGFLTGFFNPDRYDEPFVKSVKSNLIVFGYKDGQFFDDQYESEKEFRKALKELA